MEEQTQMQAVRRPWQGTTWAWLNIVALSLFAFVMMLVAIFGTAILGMMMHTQELDGGAGLFAGVFVIVLIILIPFLILDVFMIIGFFKGWKWAVIVAIIFEGLSIISSMFSIGEDGVLFSIILSGFMLYLAIVCVQHPFYNQKK